MTTITTRRSTIPPPLLRLPLEIREHIYDYLLPRENVSHPLPSIGVTSVSHRPPAAALLNIHPQLTHELLAHFYTRATWKLVFSHAFNFFRVDPDLRRLAHSPSLARMRRVEFVFFCDVLLLRSYPSFGVGSFVAEIRRRAERACEVLDLGATRLREVVVSWIDTTDTGAWAEKAGILEPLRRLAESGMVEGRRRRHPVRFRIGEVSGPESGDKEVFVEAMKTILGAEQVLEVGNDGAADEGPSKLRVLAFDVRQERHRLYGQGYLPRCSIGRSGWRGAPPALSTAFEEG